MESKNLILAVTLSMAVLLGWSWIFPPQPNVTPQNTEQAASNNVAQNASATSTPSADGVAATPAQPASISASGEVLSTAVVKTFGNDVLSVSVNERGWLTDAELKKYQLSLDDKTKVEMLTTGQYREAYVGSGVLGKKLVEPFKLVSLDETASQTVATFEGMLDGGVKWIRVYTLNQGSYLFNVKDRLVGGAGLKLYRQVVEKNPLTEGLDTYNEHNGPISLFNDELKLITYDELNDTKPQYAMGGWTGIMSRYFITAIYGANQEESYRYYYKGDGRTYQAGYFTDGFLDQSDMVFDNNIYVGPKESTGLKATGVELEHSVDFGWFAFIAKPLHEVMLWMNQYISNFGVIIILMVIAIKIILFVPTQSAYRSMASMRKLQPEMARLKDKYGSDRAKMGQEVMALYKKHQVNPLGGCLPILLQMPIFFALYKVLLISIELRQAPFYGWIEDMSVQDPFFILPILMGISMYIQMQLNPQPTDPIQAKVMKFLPIMMTALFLFFPAGLVLYWVVNNVLSIIQQRMVMKSMNVD